MKKVYVGNLAFAATDDSVLQLSVDKGYKVTSARIIIDRETGRSRGFGFVELGKDQDTAKAIEELNGLDVGGWALQVNEAREQESRRGGRGRGFSCGRSGRRNYWWPKSSARRCKGSADSGRSRAGI